MLKKDLFYCYYEAWKIISDYVDWVASGGESLYGSIDVARDWARKLLMAQSACF